MRGLEMQDDHDRGPKVARELLEHAPEPEEPAGGADEGDDLLGGGCSSPLSCRRPHDSKAPC
jgi:hypothetical protein